MVSVNLLTTQSKLVLENHHDLALNSTHLCQVQIRLSVTKEIFH